MDFDVWASKPRWVYVCITSYVCFSAAVCEVKYNLLKGERQDLAELGPTINHNLYRTRSNEHRLLRSALHRERERASVKVVHTGAPSRHDLSIVNIHTFCHGIYRDRGAADALLLTTLEKSFFLKKKKTRHSQGAQSDRL
jgi:hypothetical protein